MNILPGEIAFDVDGVFADTFRTFVEKARQWYGYDLDYESITEYEFWNIISLEREKIDRILTSILDDPLGIGIRPMPGSVEVLTRLASHGPLRFVTARHEDRAIHRWARTHLPDVDAEAIRIIPTGAGESKPPVLSELQVRYFVEDRLDTCLLLQRSAISTPIVFDQPWNRKPHPFSVVSTWEDIGAMIAWE